MGKRYPQRFKEIIKRYWKSRNEDECTAKLILYTQGVKVRQDIIVLGT